MILFLLLRRIRPQTRIVVGSMITAAGLVLVAVAAAVAACLLIHGAALAVIGAVMWISGLVSKRRAQPASEGACERPAGQRDERCGSRQRPLTITPRASRARQGRAWLA